MAPSSVLLLPGMMLDQRLFSHQLAALGDAYATVVGDLTRSESVDELAEDVLRDAPPRFGLVGLSMGGIVALEIWRRAPERVTHIGLLDTTGLCGSTRASGTAPRANCKGRDGRPAGSYSVHEAALPREPKPRQFPTSTRDSGHGPYPWIGSLSSPITSFARSPRQHRAASDH